MLGLQECKTAAEVRALATQVLARQRRRNRPAPPRRIAINDETPEAFPVEVTRTIVFQATAEQPYPTMNSIIGLICDVYGKTKLDIVSQRREAHIVLPRQIICALAVKLTPNSLPAIGRLLGGRDQTTLLHAMQKIERMRAADSAFEDQMAGFELQLGGASIKKKPRCSVWGVNPALDARLLELATQTQMPHPRIATTLNREFGVNVSGDSCYSRLYTLGIRLGKRCKLGPAPLVKAA
jgi:hypothetical protein